MGRPPMPRAWTRGAAWLPAPDATPEVRYRDPTQMGKVYLRPAGVDRAVPGLGERRAGPRRGRSRPDARGLARPDPPPSGRAQEPAPQPGLRGRDRQCLQRRDPACRSAPAVPQAVEPRRRGGRRALRGDARDAGRRDRGPRANASRRPSRSRCATSWRSTTRAASRARAAGRGSPRSRPAASSRRSAEAASADVDPPPSTGCEPDRDASGQLEDLADLELRRIGDAVEPDQDPRRRVEPGRDGGQGVAALHLVGPRPRSTVRRSPARTGRPSRGAADGLDGASVVAGASVGSGRAVSAGSPAGVAAASVGAAPIAPAEAPAPEPPGRCRRAHPTGGPGGWPRTRAPARRPATAWPGGTIGAEGRASAGRSGRDRG